MSKRKPQPVMHKPPKFKHQCSGCSRMIDTRWKFCRSCAGNPEERKRRPNVDAMSRRVPGSTSQ